MGYVLAGGGGGGSVDIGSSLSSGSAGSVLFLDASKQIAENNTSFYWDDTNTQLQLTAGGATKTPLKLILASAQSASAVEVVDSSANVLFKIGPTGQLSAKRVGANSQIVFGRTSDFVGEGVLTANSFYALSLGNTGDATQVLLVGQGGDLSLPYGSISMIKYLETFEMTAPSAPAANGVRLYAQDNGAGKTQLMALFNSGVAQQVAIEP